MCGIVTLCSFERPVSPDTLQRATRALHHRGPDGQGHWLAPHGRVGMGHTRLRIIDLVTGDQPLTNEDQTLHAVVNGELYDHERLRRELEERGHTLRTRSDSEILLHLYEEYGSACLRHLRGEFAFVLWDERNGTLFAARDRFGIKPLFYARVGDMLCLASEIKALFAAGVPAAWDHESVYQDLHIVSDNDRSLFRGVYQVPPGHYLLASRYATRLVRYWDHDYPTIDDPGPAVPEAEHIERLREALLEATRLRLRADVPVGCYLSGGLDSATLLGMAASLRSDPIEAFTIAFEQGPFDESPVAAEMARHARARFHPFRMTEETLAAHYSDAVAHAETFHFNHNHVAKYLLSERVRDLGCKVVLTGEGADEILAGYPFLRRDQVLYAGGQAATTRQQQLGELVRAASSNTGRMMVPHAGEPLPTDGVRRILGFVPSLIEMMATRGHRLRTLLRADFAAAFAGRDPFVMFLNSFDIQGQLAGREPVHQSMYVWSKTMLANKLLNLLGDRMEMAHSIEGRLPFLDHHLVELVNRMPVEMKIRGITEKYALREAARPFVTEAIYQRQKQPFMAPFELKGRLLELIQDLLRGQALRDVPFFDRAAVLDRLDAAAAQTDAEQRERLFRDCMLVASACVLQERYRP